MVGKTLCNTFLILFVTTIIVSTFQLLGEYSFLPGMLTVIVFAIYIMWVSSEKGRKELDKIPLENDPCGNDNISPRKPQDYL